MCRGCRFTTHTWLSRGGEEGIREELLILKVSQLSHQKLRFRSGSEMKINASSWQRVKEEEKIEIGFLQHDVDLKGLVYDTKANKRKKYTEKLKINFRHDTIESIACCERISDGYGAGMARRPFSQCE